MAVSCDTARFSSLYAEARQMEKRVAVARLELQQQYQLAVKQVNQHAARRIESIIKMQENSKQELQTVLSVLNASKQWDQFQRYAKEVRKIHLGGSNTSILPRYKQEAIKAYLSHIESSKSKCFSILTNFIQQIGGEEERQRLPDLSFNAATAHSQRMLERIRTQPSFQISPIKRREDLPTFVISQKDNYLTNYNHNHISSSKNNIRIEQASLHIDHLPSARPKVKKQQPKLILSIYPKEITKKMPQTNIISPSQMNLISPSQMNIISPSQLNIISHSSLRQQPKLRQSAPPQQKQTVIQSSATVRSGTSKLQKVKSESRLASPGHKAVLQILQMQQLRFDRLKHGLP